LRPARRGCSTALVSGRRRPSAAEASPRRGLDRSAAAPGVGCGGPDPRWRRGGGGAVLGWLDAVCAVRRRRAVGRAPAHAPLRGFRGVGALQLSAVAGRRVARRWRRFCEQGEDLQRVVESNPGRVSGCRESRCVARASRNGSQQETTRTHVRTLSHAALAASLPVDVVFRRGKWLYQAETPPRLGFVTDAGGGTRTPDTRIMIPRDFGLATGQLGPVGHAFGHNRIRGRSPLRISAPPCPR
jgi:hypothetical protein